MAVFISLLCCSVPGKAQFLQREDPSSIYEYQANNYALTVKVLPESDTLYIFRFKDDRYPSLTELASFWMRPQELVAFVDGLADLQKPENLKRETAIDINSRGRIKNLQVGNTMQTIIEARDKSGILKGYTTMPAFVIDALRNAVYAYLKGSAK